MTSVPHQRRVSVGQDDIDIILETLGPSALGIYVYLARRANRDGEAWPSYDTIARDCGVQRRWVMKVVASLAEAGWLEVVPNRDRRNGHAPNTYRLPRQIALLSASSPSEQPSVPPSVPPSVLPIGKEEKEEQRKNKKEDLPPGFLAFWSAYPHVRQRSVRTESLKVWRSAELEEIAPVVMAALDVAVADPDWIKEDGQYIPGAQRWLRTAPWESPLPVSTPPPPRGTIVTDRMGTPAPLPGDWAPDPSITARAARFAGVPEQHITDVVVPLFRAWASSRTSRDWQSSYLNYVRGRSWEGDQA